MGGIILSKKILIVDDTAFMRKMLNDILTKNDFEVVGQASDGLEAVEKYEELKPDLVTMDITMMEMSGIEALQEILKIDSNAKVVMCSAMGQTSMVEQALEIGAKDFIVKPFKPDRVLEAVKKTLGL